MTILRPDEVDDWIMEKANRAFSRHIQFDQGRFSEANPKATGRMAASWRIAPNQPDTGTAPEEYEGDGTPQEYSGEIVMDGTWFISNNVPYASRVALDSKWAKGGKGKSAWFTSIANASRGRLEEELRNEFRGQ